MVSTEKCYETDNFPVLDHAQSCGEWLYRVGVYGNRAPYLSPEAGNTRMRVLLGFIESRSVVIDAIVQNDENLHYLSIICASGASPDVFSGIMHKTVPNAVIEEITPDQGRQYLSTAVLHTDRSISVPHALPLHKVYESRSQLLSLLLEYRALLAECRSFVDTTDQLSDSDEGSTGDSRFTIPFVFFETEGVVHGIPEFQVQSLDSGVAGQHLIRVAYAFGPRVILCDDILSVSDVNMVQCHIRKKVRRGYYETVPGKDREAEKFVLVVPSFL